MRILWKEQKRNVCCGYFKDTGRNGGIERRLIYKQGYIDRNQVQQLPITFKNWPVRPAGPDKLKGALDPVHTNPNPGD